MEALDVAGRAVRIAETEVGKVVGMCEVGGGMRGGNDEDEVMRKMTEPPGLEEMSGEVPQVSVQEAVVSPFTSLDEAGAKTQAKESNQVHSVVVAMVVHQRRCQRSWMISILRRS